MPLSTRVYSSKSGVCPGSTQPLGALHTSHAERFRLRIHTSDEFLNDFRLVAGRLNHAWSLDECWHRRSPFEGLFIPNLPICAKTGKLHQRRWSIDDAWRVSGSIENPEGRDFRCCGKGVFLGSDVAASGQHAQPLKSRLWESLFGSFQEIDSVPQGTAAALRRVACESCSQR